MNTLAEAFPVSHDMSNSTKNRWMEKYTVVFDSFKLLASIMIRCSGDGLTSVGNYLINWTIHVTVNCLAEEVITLHDWRTTSTEEFFEALSDVIDQTKERLLQSVFAEADWMIDEKSILVAAASGTSCSMLKVTVAVGKL